MIWMGVVFVAFVYNAVAIPIRVSFFVKTEHILGAWLFFDYLFDIVYLLDIILVQFHLSWRLHGVLEVQSFRTCKLSACVHVYMMNYVRLIVLVQPNLKSLAKKYICRWKFWVSM